MAIIFTFGISDSGITRVKPDPKGQLNIHTDGNCNVLGSIDLGSVRPMPIVFYGANVKQPEVVIPEKPSLVFNQISDGDSHRTALKHCYTLCSQLKLPVINSPEAVIESTREKVSQALADIPGVIMPRTIVGQPDSPEAVIALIEKHELAWPIILRIAGDHNAISMVKMDGPGDLDQLHRFAFDSKSFYLTEWVDYSDSEGIFHKHRIAMVDGEPVVRHSMFNEHWVINSKSIPFMMANPSHGTSESLSVELESERLPKAAAALAEIHRRLGLDYFGIDCHIDRDGQILVFEANANMDLMIRGIKEQDQRVNLIKSLVRRMIQSRSGEDLG